MRFPIRAVSIRLHGSRIVEWFLLLTVTACCGCGPEMELTCLIKRDPAAACVDAVWPSQPPTAVDQFGDLYGSCIDAVAEGLILANGERSCRKSGVVVCYETSLTAAQAEVLTDSAVDIFLPRLAVLAPDVVRILGRTGGILHFSVLHSLDAVAAVQFAGSRAVLSLNGLTHLSAGAAAGLARSEGPLKLDGLQELEPGVAAALAEHVGQLSLNGLRRLSAEDAAALAGHHGDLCLNALETLCPGAAEGLASLRHGLHMNGLTELSVQDAAALSRHCGWCLGVNGLCADRLSSEAVMLLSRHHRARLHAAPAGATADVPVRLPGLMPETLPTTAWVKSEISTAGTNVASFRNPGHEK